MGSSGGSASREAQQAEEERQRQVRETQGRIEEIFSSPKREAQIQEYIDATRGVLQDDLNREKADNDRELKFALARSGLGGSSTQFDQGRRLSEAFLRASLEADRTANAAGNQVRLADQDAKMSLFQQALGGLNTGVAESNAIRSMQANLESARASSTNANLDQFFSDFANIYKTSRDADIRRREQQMGFGGAFAAQSPLFMPVAGSQSGGI